MSEEQEINNVVDTEVQEDIQEVVPVKTQAGDHRCGKKPVSQEKLEQLKQARKKALEKKQEMKELKTKTKQLPIEEMKISAMKYDQLQKQKEEIINPKEEKKEEIPISKTKDKKKRIIKKIIYEDGSEDEVEDARHLQTKPNMKYMSMFANDDSYSNLVYQSACDKLKEKVQDERTKYLIKSLMPNYG
jgi:hypothetical protein